MSVSSSGFHTPIAVRRSRKGFTNSGEFLAAMKDDLAEWLSFVNTTEITADNLINVLSNGYMLCRLADNIDAWIFRTTGNKKKPINGQKNAAKGTFFARDNVAKFIYWCRTKEIDKCGVIFETDDLVRGNSEQNVVKCLLDVARFVAKTMNKFTNESIEMKEAFPLPMLIEWEREIDLFELNDKLGNYESSAASSSSNYGASSQSQSSDRDGCVSPVDSNSSGVFSSGTISLLESPISSPTQKEEQKFNNKSAFQTPESKIPTDNKNKLPSPETKTRATPHVRSKTVPRKKPAPKCHRTRAVPATFDQKKLNEEVQRTIADCRCKHPVTATSIAPGTFRITCGQVVMTVYARVLRSTTVVRVGGGWTTLSQWFKRHDPCRAQGNSSATSVELITPLNNRTSVGVKSRLNLTSEFSSSPLSYRESRIERKASANEHSDSHAAVIDQHIRSLTSPSTSHMQSRIPKPSMLKLKSPSSMNLNRLSSPRMVKSKSLLKIPQTVDTPRRRKHSETRCRPPATRYAPDATDC